MLLAACAAVSAQAHVHDTAAAASVAGVGGCKCRRPLHASAQIYTRLAQAPFEHGPVTGGRARVCARGGRPRIQNCAERSTMAILAPAAQIAACGPACVCVGEIYEGCTALRCVRAQRLRMFEVHLPHTHGQNAMQCSDTQGARLLPVQAAPTGAAALTVAAATCDATGPSAPAVITAIASLQLSGSAPAAAAATAAAVTAAAMISDGSPPPPPPPPSRRAAPATAAGATGGAQCPQRRGGSPGRAASTPA
jgi:hypothetical protein